MEKSLVRSELAAIKIAFRLAQIICGDTPIEEEWVRIFDLSDAEKSNNQKKVMVECGVVGQNNRFHVLNLIFFVAQRKIEGEKKPRWCLDPNEKIQVLVEYALEHALGADPCFPMHALCPKADEEIRNLPIHLKLRP